MAQADALRRENEALRLEVSALSAENAKLRAGLPVPPRPASGLGPLGTIVVGGVLFAAGGVGVFLGARSKPPPPPLGVRTPVPPTDPIAPRTPVFVEPRPEPPQSPAGPRDTPTRQDVMATMTSFRAAVSVCAADTPGVVTVEVAFASSGSASRVTVRPPHADTTAGACIARALRGARVPPFTRDGFTVVFPFSVR